MRRVFALIVSMFMLTLLAACGDQYSNISTTSTIDSTDSTVAGNGNDGTLLDPKVDPKVITDELLAALTVEKPDTECVVTVRESGQEIINAEGTEIYLTEFKVQRDVGVEGGLFFSDSPSTPLAGDTAQEKFQDLQVNTCNDPYIGIMVCNYFGGKQLTPEVSFKMANEWLALCEGKPEEVIHRLAMEFKMQMVEVADPDNITDAEQAEVTRRVGKSVEYQELAGKLNTLLRKFVLGGVEERLSVLNYHVPMVSGDKNVLPPMALNSVQEDLPSLILLYTWKDICVPLLTIGFNVVDKRLEEFAPPVCETPQTPMVPPMVPSPDTPTPAPPGPSTVPQQMAPPTPVPGDTTTTTPGDTTTTTTPGGTTTTTTVPGSTTTTTSPPTTTTVPCPPPGVRKGGVCEYPPPSPTIPPATTPRGNPTTTIGPSPTAPPDPTPTGPINTVNPPVVTVPSNTGGGPTPGVTIPLPPPGPPVTSPPATSPIGGGGSD